MRFSAFEADKLIKLAVPIFLAQVTQVMMFFVDTVMSGRVSATDMAAVSVSQGLWNPALFTMQGILLALTPIISHQFGAKQSRDIPSTVFQGVYIALLLCVIGFVGYQFVEVPLQMLNLEAELYRLTIAYLDFVVIGLPPALLFFVLRNFSEGVSYTKPAVIISLIGIVINIPANYIFIYGEMGAPALGGAGCGLATSIVNWAMLFSMLIYIRVSKKLHQFQIFSRFHLPDIAEIVTIVRLGLPIAFSILFETCLFAFIPLFIASMGSVYVASHQVANNFSALVFMLPLSFSMAVTIRIGYLYGGGAIDKMRDSVKTSLIVAGAIGITTALFTLVTRNYIAQFYTNDPEVILIANSLLILAAMYQISDSFQVVSAGILKGFKLTKPLFYITFIAYWPIGFGIGYILGKTDLIVPAMGPHGFWIGIVVGLTVGAIMFAFKLHSTLKRPEFSCA
ncbi:MATE family efflux transporter [Flocculibacter collagenilyticus]|uniref:MATE family efflux transporter n=1 Tax=Flocculibacter collagenilyticus TaxID=2744479 RepID=UPI0018F470F9|nr:MATE family efflux transporter [Flocculibacter collagenilyticus]